MRLLKFTLFIFFTFLISSHIYGQELKVNHSNLSINHDSLVIQKTGARSQFIIYTGNKIQVWLENKATVKGELISFDGYAITIANGDLKLKVPTSKIEKIKSFGDMGHRILGTTIAVVGIALMVVTITGVVVGLTLIAAGTFATTAYPAIIAATLYGGIGFGLYKGGDAIIGQKVNLKKRWSIIPPQ